MNAGLHQAIYPGMIDSAAGQPAPCDKLRSDRISSFVIRWPNHIKPGIVSEQTCITLDLTTSFLRVAGAKVPSGHQLDGIDIIEHIEKGRPDVSRTLFWRGRRGDRTERAVRDGDRKYVHRRLDDGTIEEGLFDLKLDPIENNNLIKARPIEAKRLKALLEKWEAEVSECRPMGAFMENDRVESTFRVNRQLSPRCRI